MSVQENNAADARHQITRVRHGTPRRLLTVSNVTRLTPNMVRVTFVSPELREFMSAAPDDHVKLSFPTGAIGPDGEPHVEKRDYTPRRFDTARGELVVDFAIHDAGPATAWAEQAAPGQTLLAGGPRGSAVLTDDFDWYLLIGDETALPAMGRRAEEIRPEAHVVTLGAVIGSEEEQRFAARASLVSHWVHRPASAADDPAPILNALKEIALPRGEGFIWIAAEATVVKALRDYLAGERGHPRAWIKAAGYWKRGQADTHLKIED